LGGDSVRPALAAAAERSFTHRPPAQVVLPFPPQALRRSSGRGRHHFGAAAAVLGCPPTVPVVLPPCCPSLSAARACRAGSRDSGLASSRPGLPHFKPALLWGFGGAGRLAKYPDFLRPISSCQASRSTFTRPSLAGAGPGAATVHEGGMPAIPNVPHIAITAMRNPANDAERRRRRLWHSSDDC